MEEPVKGTILIQKWNALHHLENREVRFSSLQQLFEMCCRELDSGETIDQIVLHGVDREGEGHQLVLAFQSEGALPGLKPEEANRLG